jgi:hypothetical protein
VDGAQRRLRGDHEVHERRHREEREEAAPRPFPGVDRARHPVREALASEVEPERRERGPDDRHGAGGHRGEPDVRIALAAPQLGGDEAGPGDDAGQDEAEADHREPMAREDGDDRAPSASIPMRSRSVGSGVAHAPILAIEFARSNEMHFALGSDLAPPIALE